MYRIWHNVLIVCIWACIAAISSCIGYEPVNLPPTVAINDATEITRTSAVLSGSVTLQKEGEVSCIEMLWGTSPENMDNIITFDPLELEPSVAISNLKNNTTYHFQLRAGNEYTKICSAIKSFTTLPNTAPVLDGIRLLYCGILSSTVACKIDDDGGEQIQETGIIYWTGNDDTKSFKTVPYAGNEFICQLENLSPNTVYNIQAYARQNAGTGYSNIIQITTGETTVNVETPGTMSAIMDYNDAVKLADLSISGFLNSDDIRFLRTIIAPGTSGTIAGAITALNLSESRIVSGGHSYDGSHYTQNDTITTGMFADCIKLEKILFPKGTSRIDEGAFAGCTSLEELHIPAVTKHIGHSHGCKSLRAFDIDKGNSHFCSQDGILFNKECTKLIWYPLCCNPDSILIPASVTEIGEYAFSEHKFPGIMLPHNITRIGKMAFYNSLLEEITLPEAITIVPYAIFQNSAKLRRVKLGAQTEYISDFAFDGTALEEIVVEAEIPPYCTEDAFTGFDTAKCTLYIKSSSIKQYRNSRFGDCFANIKAIE